MKPQTVVIEEEITVESMLKSKGLDPNLFFVSVDGEMAKKDTVLNSSQEVKIFPCVAGG